MWIIVKYPLLKDLVERIFDNVLDIVLGYKYSPNSEPSMSYKLYPNRVLYYLTLGLISILCKGLDMNSL